VGELARAGRPWPNHKHRWAPVRYEGFDEDVIECSGCDMDKRDFDIERLLEFAKGIAAGGPIDSNEFYAWAEEQVNAARRLVDEVKGEANAT